MWVTRTVNGCRCWFLVKSLGELRAGLAPSDFTATVINPEDSDRVSPAVIESSQKPGVYYLDVPSVFTAAYGAGHYTVVVEVNTTTGGSGEPMVVDSFGSPLQVYEEDFDTLAVPGDEMVLVPAEYEAIADAVWDEASADHNLAGSMGARANLVDALISSRLSDAAQVDLTLLRKALTNRMETLSGNPGKLILYDDDTTTPIMMWNLTDSLGGAVLSVAGSPAKRAAGT